MVVTDIEARVVINERTGTVVAGGNVIISEVLISHGDLTIHTQMRPVISQPSALSEQGETVVEKLEDITGPIDIVNVFRPSNEVPAIAKQAVKKGTKVLWLQYGIQNKEAKEIVESENIIYIENKCIKQEYQRLFLKISPVFPVLKK